jgi:hypothetical protein
MLGAGMSPSDRQFSARRSVEDPQDTLRSDLAFPVTTTAPLRTVCHRAVRNILRIGPRATRQIRPLSDRPFRVTTMAPLANGRPPGDTAALSKNVLDIVMAVRKAIREKLKVTDEQMRDYLDTLQDKLLDVKTALMEVGKEYKSDHGLCWYEGYPYPHVGT